MRNPKLLAFALVSLIAAGGARAMARRSFVPPFPDHSQLVFGNDRLQDIAFLSSGFRRLAADAAWIQYLQFIGVRDFGRGGYATPEELESGVMYPGLMRRTLRIVRLDPWFRQAYLYGASIFAWSPATKNPANAVALLQEAIRYEPDYWMYKTFLAAIAFRERDQFGRMAGTLEEALSHPDCPPMIKSILANFYKSEGRHVDALKLWQNLLNDDRAPEYHERAAGEIVRLRAALKRER
jgi:tetratricopeptide (TPR) repeat protein